MKAACNIFTVFLIVFTFQSISLCAQDIPQLDETVNDSKTSNREHVTLQKELLDAVQLLNLGQYSKAHHALKILNHKASELDSSNVSTLALNNIGNLFYYLNEPDSALFYYFQALSIAEKGKKYHLQNTINNNIGIIYSTSGNINTAQEYFSKALAISILAKDTVKMTINLSNLGILKLKNNDLNGADSDLNKALALFIKINDTSGLSTIYNSLGDLALARNKPQEALDQYSIAYELAKYHPINKLIFSNNMGRAYLQLEKPDSAQSFLLESYSISMEHEQYTSASQSLNWLIDVEMLKENHHNAIQYAREAIDLKDSIINREQKNWNNQSKIKYDFQLREREIQLLESNLEKRKLLVRIIIISLIIIIILLVVILRMKLQNARQKREELKKENIQSQQKVVEIEAQNKELEQQIASINYELISQTLLVENKNQILESINSWLSQPENTGGQHINKLKQQLLLNNNLDQNWEQFRVYFERLHADFFKNLHEKHPNLTSNDLRLAAYLLLQFNTKELSQMLNISPDSMRKRKQRLREKLGLEKGDDVINYLYSYS